MASGIMARCPRCRGWTMFHADAGSLTAHDWSAACRIAGDVIELLGDDPNTQMGKACKSADVDAYRRTCEVAVADEAVSSG